MAAKKGKPTTAVKDEAAKEAPESFYVVIINTGKDSDPLQLRVSDPKEAQKLATAAVERGTYTVEIENGIRVVPVRGADVVGPLTEQEVPANDES